MVQEQQLGSSQWAAVATQQALPHGPAQAQSGPCGLGEGVGRRKEKYSEVKSKNSAQAGPVRNTMQEPGPACLPVRTSQPVGKGPGLASQGNYETGVDLSLQKKESNQEPREHRAPFQQPHPRAAGSHRAGHRQLEFSRPEHSRTF